MTDATTAHSICYKLTCGAVIAGDHSYCPKCGGRMKSERTVRLLGWVMVALGVFLVGLIGFIISAISPALNAAISGTGEAPDGSRFNATAGAASSVLWLLWVIFGFGVLDLINGLYQGISGRRSRVMNLLLLLCALGIVIMAVMTVSGLKSAA